MTSILICDDNEDIVQVLTLYLTDPDYLILPAYSGQEALDILEREEVKLILLDIMMPGMDGLTALARIRQSCNIPVILITAKAQDEDKILGLNLGADDYITKPFNPLEVMARVRSCLRRYLKLGSALPEPDSYTVKGLSLNKRTRQVLLDGEELSLTPKEFQILLLLMQHPGEVFSPRDIYAKVWQEKPYGADNIVAVHIRHLREKIEFDPSDPRYIKMIFGQGYKIEKE